MANIYQLPTQLPGTVGIYPNFKYMVVGDNLATLTAAGYLNPDNLQGFIVSTKDVLQVLYSFDKNTGAGTFGVFTVSKSGGVITLVEDINEGNVVLPSTSNTLSYFTNTAGKIASATFLVVDNDASTLQVDGTLLTYKDNATSFRLKGPSSPNDPSAGADVQSYSGIFYHDSYSDFGVLKTRATYGANVEMDLVLQAPRALLLIAYDGTQTDGVIKMASQTDIEIAPRSSGVVAATNYANFDALTTGSVDNASAITLNTHVNHLYFQEGKTTQAIVVPNLANASVTNLTTGVLIYDSSANKLMVYTGAGFETITSA